MLDAIIKDEAVAEIRAAMLKELWIHTGTACNLECPFCLEGSKPGDTRLERVTLAELKPYLDAAAKLGAQRFTFTGGEPLIVKDIGEVLGYALQLLPCVVFTNGTAPLIKRTHQLRLLKQQPHPLSFRVSIDHPDEQAHDAQRGWGNFKRALNGIKLLHQHGFAIAIARHQLLNEDGAAVDARYRELLRKQQLPDNFPITALPEFGLPTAGCNAAPVTSAKLTASKCSRTALMCSDTRMVLKRNGQMRVIACALVDDDPRFDMGADLAASLAEPVALRHGRCHQCLLGNRY